MQFAQMLINGGQLNGKRLLSPRTVDLMASVHVPDITGRPAGGAGTHFWVDRKEGMIAILMMQTNNAEIFSDFENAVMQAIVE